MLNRAKLKSVSVFAVAALFVCACHKGPEPTYQNRTMSDWARQVLDKDDTLRAEALWALSRFDISTGTRQTVRDLESIAANDDFEDDERGAAIAVADWLSGGQHSDSSRDHRDEIPLLFATITEHDQDGNWHNVSHLCAIYLGYLYHNGDDAKEVESSARKFLDAGIAKDNMTSILETQERFRSVRTH